MTKYPEKDPPQVLAEVIDGGGDEDEFITIQRSDGDTRTFRQCTARSKQNDRRCRRPCVPGFDVCHFHGGKSLRGVAAPRFAHGRYSKYAPARITAIYEEALSDPDLLGMQADVALAQTRIIELLGSLDEGGALELWKDLRSTYGEYREARADRDPALMAEKLDELGEIIESGTTNAELWDDIGDWLEKKRKLAESERRTQIRLQEVVTVSQINSFLRLLVEVLTRRLSENRHILEAIVVDIDGAMETLTPKKLSDGS